MAFFINKASQLERAARALIILQGASDDDVTFAQNGDCFVSNDSRTRSVLPNRTIFCPRFMPARHYRSEGVCHLQIEHHLPAVLQPDDTNLEQQRIQVDKFVGDTIDIFNIGSGLDQALPWLADAITKAGRWLATPDPNGVAGDAADLIVQNNLDMVNFRCDWIKFASPFITQGNVETDSVNWVEILNFEAFVSHSTLANESLPAIEAFPAIPLVVTDGMLVPTVDNSGNIIAWPFLDQVTGQVVYLRIQDSDVVLSNSLPD